MYQVGYDPLNSAGFRATGQTAGENSANEFTTAPTLAQRSDCVRPGFPSPWNPGGGNQSGPGGIVAGFSSFISQMFSALTNFMNSLGGSQVTAGAEQAFQSASFASSGDPHLALDGTTNAGQAVDSHWDSMASHDNLVSSDSFSGGYQLCTQVTDPNANGVTLNRSATVVTDGGNMQISLDRDGNAALVAGGQNIALQRGQQYVLGNGELLTDNSDGSLAVSDSNGQGGSIATLLRSNGAGGVDVSATASNVDLGGYLVTKSDDAGIIDASVPSLYAPPFGYAPQSQNPFSATFPQPTQTAFAPTDEADLYSVA